jgi:peptidylprolyl isomerase
VLAVVAAAIVSACGGSTATHPAPPAARSLADILKASAAQEWRQPDPANTLYMDLASGRVVIELAPLFTPLHADNIRALVREGYFDGLAIERVQDNFVTQWGDADGTRAVRTAARTLAPEFTRPIADDPGFTPLGDRDVYAPEVGFVAGFPAARDPQTNTAWLLHCYGMVGAGRGNDANTGNGAELYAVIGHAPRQIDRNAALVGRVLQGMEQLASLPRGTGPLGFYQKREQRVPIVRIRVAADVPASARTRLEVLRTDSATFRAIIEQRRNRRDDWYKVPAGHVDVCNVPIPVRGVQ